MRVALITGGSGAIGSAIARKLNKCGYKPVIGYFSNKKNAENVASELGTRAVFIDVTDEVSVKNAVREVEKDFGKITVLVNASGVALVQKVVTDVTAEEFDRVFAVNVKGAFNCVKAVLPDMFDAGYGDVVNISSVWGSRAASCEVVYAASKGALDSFTVSLAEELSLSGIRVNAVAPSFVDTPMNAHLTDEDKRLFIEENGLSSLTTPGEVACAVADVLAGEKTGEIIVVENKL